VILGAGLGWYAVKGCHHIGTLASHTLTPGGGTEGGLSTTPVP
jgi:hypothetical protein